MSNAYNSGRQNALFLHGLVKQAAVSPAELAKAFKMSGGAIGGLGGAALGGVGGAMAAGEGNRLEGAGLGMLAGGAAGGFGGYRGMSKMMQQVPEAELGRWARSAETNPEQFQELFNAWALRNPEALQPFARNLGWGVAGGGGLGVGTGLMLND